MNNIDKISLLKELDICTRLLKKHEALKKEKELKSAINHQLRISQHTNKLKSFHSYKKVKNESNPASCFNQKYSFKQSTRPAVPNQNVQNSIHNQSQNFNSKYSLSKNKFSNSTFPVKKLAVSSKNLNSNGFILHPKSIASSKSEIIKIPCLSSNKSGQVTYDKFAVNSKNLSSNGSILHPKSISSSKSQTIKVPCMSPNKSGKVTYDTKDFMKKIESITELLKKTSSASPLRVVPNSENVIQNKQSVYKKEKISAFKSANLVKKETTSPKAKCSIEMPSKMLINGHCVNKRNYFLNAINKNSHQQKVFSQNKFVYKKNNVNHSLNKNTATSLRSIENTNDSKGMCKKIISKPASRKVIFSNSKKLLHDLHTPRSVNRFQIKPMPSSTQLFMKLRTPNRTISSAKKTLKKSPHVAKMKTPVLLKMRSSNAVKTPNIIKLKQTNTRYTKINKHLTPPHRKVLLRHQTPQKSSVKKSKKKVNNKYKVINKAFSQSLSKKTANSLRDSVSKRKSLDSDVFLKNLSDPAVEKLEQNLLILSSELTAPLSSEKIKEKVIQPLPNKLSSKMENKITPFKKSKSRISKYKIINSNVSLKNSAKDLQSVPLRRERAILVRRLFKSKNVIINKNASPTSYSAKVIKSKYISLNKRKSANWQKYMYAKGGALSTKFKGPYLSTNLHLKQKRFKPNSTSRYHSRLIRKTDYRYLTYKNSKREMKNKLNNKYACSPVVNIQGTKYAINLNGKTLRKLPTKGYTVKNFSRGNTRLIMKASENVFKSSPTSTNLANRALHRSINRILTASSKKKLSKVNTYCMFYNRFGRCNRGVKCTYIHDPSKIAVCTRFLRGTCKIDGCPFSHEVDPGKMAICSFFLVGQCDNENCPYRHEKLLPNATLCKEFVQGYCHYGKECKKAHILICPKYMQGDCDKGSSCTFPHPPQKASKNIQKEVEDGGIKPSEVLLEKVLRYFQQGGDTQNEMGGKSTCNLFVPKQKKLEQQPSFIPLSNN